MKLHNPTITNLHLSGHKKSTKSTNPTKSTDKRGNQDPSLTSKKLPTKLPTESKIKTTEPIAKPRPKDTKSTGSGQTVSSKDYPDRKYQKKWHELERDEDGGIKLDEHRDSDIHKTETKWKNKIHEKVVKTNDTNLKLKTGKNWKDTNEGKSKKIRENYSGEIHENSPKKINFKGNLKNMVSEIITSFEGFDNLPEQETWESHQWDARDAEEEKEKFGKESGSN